MAGRRRTLFEATLPTFFLTLLLFSVVGLFSCDLPVLSQDSAVVVWDGSPSDDVVEYRVYFGSSPGVCRQSGFVSVHAPGSPSPGRFATTFVDLTPGVYYFAVTALDAAGNESECSEEVSKEIVR